jgi:hypothetical protein
VRHRGRPLYARGRRTASQDSVIARTPEAFLDGRLNIQAILYPLQKVLVSLVGIATGTQRHPVQRHGVPGGLLFRRVPHPHGDAPGSASRWAPSCSGVSLPSPVEHVLRHDHLSAIYFEWTKSRSNTVSNSNAAPVLQTAGQRPCGSSGFGALAAAAGIGKTLVSSRSVTVISGASMTEHSSSDCRGSSARHLPRTLSRSRSSVVTAGFQVVATTFSDLRPSAGEPPRTRGTVERSIGGDATANRPPTG